MVVNRHGQGFLGALLPNNVLVELLFDLCGFWQRIAIEVRLLLGLFFKNLIAKYNTLIADVYGWARNDLLNLADPLSAERATDRIAWFLQHRSAIRDFVSIGRNVSRGLRSGSFSTRVRRWLDCL